MKRRQRGVVLKTILNKLEEGSEKAIDVFIAFLNAGYGISYKKFEYELSKLKDEKLKKQKKNFISFISRLKKQGLIKEDEDIYKLTTKGRDKLKKMLPTLVYKKEESKDLSVVIFDIPEKHRKKRYWLRSVLQNLDFKMKQQSVWVGKSKIPKDFIEDIHNLKLDEYIEIFKVTSHGTLDE
ncbi:MAG: hypothetical protein WDZ80_06480 [Candidatus Paceibacterota bacterium]